MRRLQMDQGNNRNVVLLKAVMVGTPEKYPMANDILSIAFEIYRNDGTVLATRHQIPVIPASR